MISIVNIIETILGYEQVIISCCVKKKAFSKEAFARCFDSFFQGGKCTEIFIIFAPSKNILAFGSFVVN